MELLNKFHKQVLFFSENGKSNIENPGIMISEIEKMSGASRSEVIEIFKKSVDIGFIEKVEEEEYMFRIKTNLSLEEFHKMIITSFK
jgi:Fic family protein